MLNVKKYVVHGNTRKIVAFIFLILLILGLYYFSFLPLIMPDSMEYYKNSQIIMGNMPIDTWWQIRGPGLSLFIALIIVIFGDSLIGFLMGTFLFYLIFLLFVFLATKKIINLLDNRLSKLIFIALILLLLVFNPILIGYYHAMLTEFVAITLATAVGYLSIKWMSVDLSRKNLVKNITYAAFFGVTTIYAWLLKQPYVTLALLPVIIASFLSILKDHTVKNTLYRLATTMSCLLFLFVGNYAWQSYLCGRIECSSAGESSSYFSKGLINGLSSVRRVYDDDEENFIKQNKLVSLALPNSNIPIGDERHFNVNHQIYKVYGSEGRVVDYVLVKTDSRNNTMSAKQSLDLILLLSKNHPIEVIKGYAANYLVLADIIGITFSPLEDNVYRPIFSHYFINGGENYGIGFRALSGGNTIWWRFSSNSTEPVPDYLGNYVAINKPNKLIQAINNRTFGWYQLMFRLLFLFLPIMLLSTFVKIVKNIKVKDKSKRARLNEISFALSAISFMHIMSHVLTGAIIDRYIIAVFPLTLLAFLCFLSGFIRKTKGVVSTNTQNNDRLLFVVPAYNEAANIAGVIKDISKHMPKADILVINDNSKDDTAAIVESMGVICINMPFNVRYAMAVQTGIKYANDNNYGYVIQFDADGQHLASEAKKLYEEIKKSKVDIVIGSRFLEKTNYKHPLPRLIGTKINSAIVELICGKKISDPTSGLQCLNQRVIKKYSAMGGYPEYPDANLVVDMLLGGYQISEVPVLMKVRETGESMHSGIIKPVKYAVKVTYSIFIITLRNLEIRRKK